MNEEPHLTAEDHYRELFENASDLVYTHDLEGRLTSVNKAAERIAGYSREEALGMSIWQFLSPESCELAQEMIRQELGGTSQITFEVTLLTKDQRRAALEIGARLLFKNGIPVGVQGIGRDITARKRAEALERDRNHVLELVAANASQDLVLSRLSKMVEGQLPGTLCSVLLNRSDRLVLGAGPSLTAALVEALERAQADSRNPPLDVLSPRATPSVFDVASEPALRPYRALLLEQDYRTCWSFPIMSGDERLLGAFLLFCQGPGQPAPPDVQVLDAARRLAVVAIEHEQLAGKLVYQARHDSLTGLPNRILFVEKIEQALADARRHNWLLAVLFIDLDRFKQINDTLGHATGDIVLQQVARRLESCLRKGDSLARLGGDEFTLVLTSLSDSHDAVHVGRKLLEALRDPFVVEGYELFLTASIGISLYPRDGRDASTLQRNADIAMYRAKNRGKNGIELFAGEPGSTALERLEIENALRRAMEHSELDLYYQPQADKGGRLAGLEALLVWRHPKLGVIPPAQFISVAEDSGMIVPIGAWVLAEACRRGASWQRAGHRRVTVAVNVSPMQFARTDFVETVAQALAQSGMDPSLLELELTENVVMRDLEESARQMDRLRALGVSISIDDFGTGYSSLSYLRRLPIDALKIDQSFLKEVEKDAHTIPLVQAIVTLAHGLGLTVVAEGVETQHQFDVLREVGCDRFQGYLLGESLPAEAAERLLKEAGPIL